MAVGAALLAAKALSVGHGQKVVGRDVDLTIESGQVLAVLGPNGSGKTTLFRTLLGLLPALSGSILIQGEDSAGWCAVRRARVFGYVPQAAPGYFPFTVMDMVLMGRTAHLGRFAAPSRADRNIAARVLAEMRIAHLAERDYTRISGGERQLALIARALAQEPLVLVLDEPSANLDYANQLLLLDRLGELARQDIAILFSTHHPDQALAVATHALLLKDGTMHAFGPAGAVLNADALSQLFGVRLAVEFVAGSFVCVREPGSFVSARDR